MCHDIIIIGGSYAGMAAALQLLRARRTILVVDAGERRNRFSSHSHGFLGQDGSDAGDIVRKARRQLEQYPTLTWIDGTATQAEGEKDAFCITLADGGRHEGRRVLFATGVSDELPEIDGLSDRWGKSIYHCPYCHGYELDRGPVGVIATGPMSTHQAELLTDWGAVTLFLNDTPTLDDKTRANLSDRNVTIEETPIAQLIDHAGVALSDGRRLSFAGLFVATRTNPASSLAAALGCDITATPMGTQITTSESKETSIPGAFACGDVARAPHSVSLAVADGAWAGAQIHRSLVWPDS